MSGYGAWGLWRNKHKADAVTPLLSFLCVVGCTGSLILAFCLVALPDTPLTARMVAGQRARFGGWMVRPEDAGGAGLPFDLGYVSYHFLPALRSGASHPYHRSRQPGDVGSTRQPDTSDSLQRDQLCHLALDCRASFLLAVRDRPATPRGRGSRRHHDGSRVGHGGRVTSCAIPAALPSLSHFSRGLSVVQIWRQHFAIVAFSHLAAGSASFVLLVLLRAVSPIALAAVLPLLVIFQLAMRSWVGRLDDAAMHVAKVTKLHLSTVSALCDGHRSQRRRDQRSHPSCPSLRDGARPRPRHHRSADAAGD